MNRKSLLSAVRARGYADASPTLDSVKAFIEDNNLLFEDIDGNVIDVSKAWNTKDVVKFEDDPPAAKPAIKAASRESLRASSGDVDVARSEDVAKRFAVGRSTLERKAYNAKAALGRTRFPDADVAEFAGAYLRSEIAKAARHDDYNQKSTDDAILKSLTTTVNTAAGALVPADFVASLLYSTESYGVGRKVCNIQQTGRDQVFVPRKTGIMTMSFGVEGGSIGTTDNAYDMVEITPKKCSNIAKVSAELLENSAINVADDIGSTFVEAYDKTIDGVFVNGDGSATYGGMVGLASSVGSTVTSVAGTSTGWTGLVLSDFTKMMGTVANVNFGRSVWLCTREFYFQVVMKLQVASSQFASVIGSQPGFDFQLLGRPGLFCEVMPTSTGSSQKCAYFGDFTGGVTIGECRGLSVDFSNQAYWSNDIVAWRGTARFGLVVHGTGRSGNQNMAALVTG